MERPTGSPRRRVFVANRQRRRLDQLRNRRTVRLSLRTRHARKITDERRTGEPGHFEECSTTLVCPVRQHGTF